MIGAMGTASFRADSRLVLTGESTFPHKMLSAKRLLD
jgi:hypothetical protein